MRLGNHTPLPKLRSGTSARGQILRGVRYAPHNTAPATSFKFQVTSSQPLTPNPRAEAEAEACFHRATEIARHQQAKSLELRAVMSLSRLWQQQGKKEEARRMLVEIYGWFTEGFDTADLKEAKALLEELG
jgi:hypothetical protein